MNINETTWTTATRTTSQGVIAYSGQTVAATKVFVKPDRVQRKLPVDLFAATTARDVQDVRKSFGSIVFVGPNGDITRTTVYDLIGNGVSSPAFPIEPSGASSMKVIDGKLRKKILDQKVDLGTALAEYRQTADLVTTLAKDIYRTYQSVRHGRGFDDLFRTLGRPRTRNGRAAARRWLELQYGLRPLMSDVFGSAEALRKSIIQGAMVYARVRATESFSGPVTTPYGTCSASVELRMKGVARYRVSYPALKQLSEVGIVNPAAVVWELIPYSFVIDWVLPVGNFLQGLSALVGVTDLQVARSYWMRRYQNLHVTKAGGSNIVTQPGDFLESYSRSQRYALDGTLNVGTLRLKNGASLEHMLNATALIRQLKR